MGLLAKAVEVGWISPHGAKAYTTVTEDALYGLLLDRFHVSESHLMQSISSEHPSLICKSDPTPLFRNAMYRVISEQLVRLYEDDQTVGYALWNPYTPLPTTSGKSQQRYWISRDHFQKLSGATPVSIAPASERFTPLIDELLAQAESKSASDIHFFSQSEGCNCAFRVHGQLYTVRHYDKKEWDRLRSLLKFYGHMDLADHLLPQDGRLMAGGFSARIASLPSLHGEDMVIRLTQTREKPRDLERLGMHPTVLSAVKEMGQENSGLVLVTGPTGSGKTTTLYGLMDTLLAERQRVIVTLEDPIERDLNGVRQSQINRVSGYGFTEGLRASLRQDPDVILIGEIRDKETAKIAIEAAYTGHLVLSSLHTATVRDSLFRLLSFELDPFLLGHSLRGVVSQKLESISCTQCDGKGCASCDQAGMIGRRAYHDCFQAKTRDMALTFQTIESYLQKGTHWTFEMDREAKADEKCGDCTQSESTYSLSL